MSLSKKSRILITGGKGFLGTHLDEELRNQGYENVFTASGVRQGLDLGEEANVGWLFDFVHPEYVIHLASRNGGVGANFKYAGGLMYENLNMSIKIIEEARQYDVKRIINVADIACYPSNSPIPYVENDFWNGYPHLVKAHYAIAKRTMTDMLSAYRKQFGMKNTTLIFSDIYGPKDEFDPHAGKIIPSVLTEARFSVENNVPQFVSSGSSKSTRDFIYVDDCVKAISLALENENTPELMNIGSGVETKITELIKNICELYGYEGDMIWQEKPSHGIERRFLDTSRAKKYLGFEAQTSLETGIAKTINWYNTNMSSPQLYRAKDLPPSLQALR
jgi:GDP-L-fucose synthase